MSELLANLALGFSVAAHPYNIGFCLLGALVGTLGRRASWYRHGGDRCHASADHVWIAACRRVDHARRHLLRGSVRRLDHVGARKYSRRSRLGRYVSRWPPDGEARPCRRRTVDRCHRLVLCGLRLHRACGGAGHAADLTRAALRSGGIFLADGARPHLRGCTGERFGPQRHRHDPDRSAAVDGRVRP